MQRNQLIQFLINKYDFQTYLEIGVREGDVFFLIKCKKKIAVDPDFAFKWKQRIKKTISRLSGSQFYSVTSDIFFDKYSHKVFSKRKLDIVLVDGMHEMEFALNDILNSLKHLSDDGYIIVHDCNPPTTDCACSFDEWRRRSFEGVWNGDVWKAILYLIRNRADLEVFVIDTDNGLGVIRKSKTEKPVKSNSDASLEEIRKMSFADLDKNRKEFLNLKEISIAKQLIEL